MNERIVVRPEQTYLVRVDVAAAARFVVKKGLGPSILERGGPDSNVKLKAEKKTLLQALSSGSPTHLRLSFDVNKVGRKSKRMQVCL